MFRRLLGTCLLLVLMNSTAFSSGEDQGAICLNTVEAIASIKTLASKIEPAAAAQRYLAMNKQIIDKFCLSIPVFIASIAQEANGEKDFGVHMGQVISTIMQALFDAINDEFLELNVLRWAMGTEVIKAEQAALQMYFQTAFQKMIMQADLIDMQEGEKKLSREEVVAEISRIFQEYCRDMVKAMADRIGQYHKIDRVALGL